MNLDLMLYYLLVVFLLPLTLVSAILWRQVCINIVGGFLPNYVNCGFATGYQALCDRFYLDLGVKCQEVVS
jgi:hypothetical protein